MEIVQSHISDLRILKLASGNGAETDLPTLDNNSPY